VSQLARRGLLRIADDVSDRRRFDMHPLVHDVARDRLASGEDLGDGPLDERLEAVYARHGAYYAQLGTEGALEALSQRGGWVRRARYFVEAENLAVASERAIGRHDATTSAACALALSAIESLTGREAKAVQRLVAASSIPGISSEHRIRCQIARGEALVRDRRLDSAAQILEAAASEARSGTDERLYATSLRSLAHHRLAACRYDEARGLAEQAGALSSQHGDRTGHAAALEILGVCAHAHGDLVNAKRQLQQARLTYDQLGERSLEAGAFVRIAQVHADQGRTDQALAALDAGLTVLREQGDRLGEAQALGLQGELLLDAGRREGAAERIDDAVGRCRELGACHLEGRFMGAQAETKHGVGQNEAAFKVMAEAERLLRSDRAHGSFELVLVLCRRARMELRGGAPDAARQTLSQIHRLLNDLGPPPLEVRRALTMTHHAMGASAPPV
jgi:tetratricopeptide (TPR) repeat protein